MCVLIAGHSLGEIGGVQRYERDLASWLLARGHSPVVYATELGDAARQLDARTQRVLRMPVAGPAATWALRRLIRPR